MPPLDPVARDIHAKAQMYAEKNVYTLSNPYTTKEEKVAIESWYQLPFHLAGTVYLLACVAWVHGFLSPWHAYGIAAAAALLTPLLTWFAYNRKLVFGLCMFLNFPVVNWFVHIGCALWLALSGSPMPATFVAGNRLLLLMPTGFWAVLTNQILTSKYKMHPKYAFLKHFYGKVYPFE